VSPFAKKGYVDHTQYDTTSILRFIIRRFDLPILPGLAARDRALTANGHAAMGDLQRRTDILGRGPPAMRELAPFQLIEFGCRGR